MLISTVSRLPRYMLLLREILKNLKKLNDALDDGAQVPKQMPASVKPPPPPSPSSSPGLGAAGTTKFDGSMGITVAKVRANFEPTPAHSLPDTVEEVKDALECIRTVTATANTNMGEETSRHRATELCTQFKIQCESSRILLCEGNCFTKLRKSRPSVSSRLLTKGNKVHESPRKLYLFNDLLVVVADGRQDEARSYRLTDLICVTSDSVYAPNLAPLDCWHLCPLDKALQSVDLDPALFSNENLQATTFIIVSREEPAIILKTNTRTEHETWVQDICREAASRVDDDTLESLRAQFANQDASGKKAGSSIRASFMPRSSPARPSTASAFADSTEQYEAIKAICELVATHTTSPESADAAYDTLSAHEAASARAASSSQNGSQAAPSTASNSDGRDAQAPASGSRALPLLAGAQVQDDDVSAFVAATGVGRAEAVPFVIAQKNKGRTIDSIIEFYIQSH